jgi:DNA-binding NarL/FixJ family response regulator
VVEPVASADQTVRTTHARAHRTVVVVDDHKTFADLLRIALSTEEDLECVGLAYDLNSGLELVERLHPDLVVIDFQFADDERDGVDATTLIRSMHPDTQVVLLTGYPDVQVMHRAAAAGASSLMAKDGSLPDLLIALRTARPGGLVVHPRLLRTLVTQPQPGRAAAPDLSPREEEVLRLLTLGLDARTIARRLGISLSTCRGYVKTLLRKLDAHSQLEAVAIARRRGLASADDR